MKAWFALGLFLLTAGHLRGQQPTGDTQHDHRLFTCLENGLVGGKASGCQMLARVVLQPLPPGLLFWELRTFPTLRDAAAARGPGDVVAEADGRVWLFRLGSRTEARPDQGVHVASVGPLPLPQARSYQLELYYVVMPPEAHTVVHTHPGPEAWYLLAGEQCLETPLGAARAKAVEGSVAPPGGTPMRLTNNGTGIRRALFIVVHDPELSWTARSDWRPTGACER